jgi:Domain of unknown function (DUF4430)
MSRSKSITSAAFAVLVVLLAGCGLGAGMTPKHIELTVTQDFGAHPLASTGAPHVVGQETVMSLLRRNYAVSTRFGGGFVQSINSHAGGRQQGHSVDWFYYVNGVEAGKGAADTRVHAGDSVWWDLHDWSQTDDIPAVVGSFPEPFLAGIDGKRLPVRVECADVGAACTLVRARLRALGVPAAVASVGITDEPHSLRVEVGPWSALTRSPILSSIPRGPRASGVYARFAANGQQLVLLDGDGRPTDTLGAGAGLVAATSNMNEPPVWMITGTDVRGVQLAAHALDAAALYSHFALALSAAGAALPLPTP